MRDALGREGIALVQMVTPVTPRGRLAMLAGDVARIYVRGHEQRYDGARRGAGGQHA